MPLQDITALPTAPARSDAPEVFIERADAFVAALPGLVTEINTLGDQLELAAAMINAAPEYADAGLVALTGLTPAADKVPYWTSSSASATFTVTSVARTLTSQTTQALMRTAGLGMSSNGSSLVAAADYAAMRALLSIDTAYLVPAGVIMLWSGSVASIPSGWVLCDGTSGTPDLRNKFIVGAGSTYAVADTGGATTHDHGGATGSHVLTTAELPAHSHSAFANATSASNITGGGPYAAWSTASSSGNQDYDIKGTATAPTLGTTSDTGSGTGHTHTVSSASNLPPYYALAYIMKT